MEPDEVRGHAAFEADRARRIRDAVVTEVPRRRVLSGLLAVATALALVGLVLLVVR